MKWNVFPRNTKMFAPNVTCVVVLTMFSNRNCDLSSTHAIFLLGHIFLCEWWKQASVTNLLPLSESNLSLWWKRFLRRTQTNGIKTVIIGRKTLIQASFGSPAMLFKLIYSPARSAQITLMKFNLTREKHLSFLSRLTKSVNKTPSGMLSERMAVVKTRP